MPPARLTPAETADRLAALNAAAASPWALDGNAISRTFTFADFDAAFAFMARVAAEAARLDHHPDWRNRWNRVDLRLLAHDAGGLTGLDFTLAAAMERLAGTPPIAPPGQQSRPA